MTFLVRTYLMVAPTTPSVSCYLVNEQHYSRLWLTCRRLRFLRTGPRPSPEKFRRSWWAARTPCRREWPSRDPPCRACENGPASFEKMPFEVLLFFAKFVHIMLVLPRAVHPSINFFVKENRLCCTSLRDLIKDALLRDRKRRKKPNTWQESNPWPQELCYAGASVLYNCATTTARMSFEFFFIFPIQQQEALLRKP